MAQNITWLGNQYSNVPFVSLPKTGGGTVQFDDTSDADATAEDILDGKTAYVDGVKVVGTGSGGGGTVSGDRILNAEGTYDVSSLATATYIYPALAHAYINVSSYYWAYYTDSSTSFCFEVQPNKRYTLTWDDTISFNLYRIGFTKSRHYPSTSSTGSNYRRNIYDASGERGVEQNGFVKSFSFTPSEGLVLCVVQIEGNTSHWTDGTIFSYFIDKMKHLTITVE